MKRDVERFRSHAAVFSREVTAISCTFSGGCGPGREPGVGAERGLRSTSTRAGYFAPLRVQATTTISCDLRTEEARNDARLSHRHGRRHLPGARVYPRCGPFHE